MQMLLPFLLLFPFGGLLLALFLRFQAEMTTAPRLAGRLTFASVLCLALAILFHLVLAIANPLCFLLFFFVIGRWVHYEILQRGTRIQAAELDLLWLLALATKAGRPLDEELRDYALQMRGRQGDQLREFADALRDGVPLRDCLPHELFSHATALQLQAALNANSFPEALTALAISRSRALMVHARITGKSLVAYPLLLLLTMMAMGSLMMIFIIPKFKKIFDDFGTELPRMTLSFLALSDFVMQLSPLIVLAGIALVAVVIKQVVTGKSLDGADDWREFLGRLFVRPHTPEILRCLSTAIAAGEPLPRAVQAFIQCPGPRVAQSTLETFVDNVRHGEPCWETLRWLGVIHSREQKLIESAERAGNLPWVLQTIADTLERRWSFRFNAMVEVLRPLLVILVSLLVGYFAIAMFLPLVKLLNDLS